MSIPVLKETQVQPFRPIAENDNSSGDLPDEAVLRAARYLVERHSHSSPVDLKAFDTPHKALSDIAGQLESMGLDYAMSGALLKSLRGYVVQSGGAFAAHARAKPIAIHVCIRNGLPPRRFENGMTEVAFVGRRQARVEGASSINVRLTATGTATTSNAANVDAMFANIGETGLWIRFEAPTKEDLAGLMTAMESGLAAATQAIGGVMDAGDLKRILNILQKDGVITPQVETLVKALIQLQKSLSVKEGDVSPQHIAQIIQTISETLSNPDYINLIPPSFAQAVLETLQSVSLDPVIKPVLVENGFGHLSEAQETLIKTQILETIAEALKEVLIIDGVDSVITDQVQEIIAEVESIMAGAQQEISLEILQSAVQKVEEILDIPMIPEPVMALLENIIVTSSSSLSAISVSSPPLKMAETLYDMVADIAAKIESGEISPESLPDNVLEVLEVVAEIKSMEGFDDRKATIENLAKVLEGKGDPDFSIKIETMVLSLTRPDIQSFLPPSISVQIQSIIQSYPSIVESVATQSVLRSLIEHTQMAPTGSDDAKQSQTLIETIRKEGLASVVLDTKLQTFLPMTVQLLLKENPSIVQVVTAQLGPRALDRTLQSLPPISSEDVRIQKIVELIKKEGISVVAADPRMREALPAPLQKFITENPVYFKKDFSSFTLERGTNLRGSFFAETASRQESARPLLPVSEGNRRDLGVLSPAGNVTSALPIAGNIPVSSTEKLTNIVVSPPSSPSLAGSDTKGVRQEVVRDVDPLPNSLPPEIKALQEKPVVAVVSRSPEGHLPDNSSPAGGGTSESRQETAGKPDSAPTVPSPPEGKGPEEKPVVAVVSRSPGGRLPDNSSPAGGGTSEPRKETAGKPVSAPTVPSAPERKGPEEKLVEAENREVKKDADVSSPNSPCGKGVCRCGFNDAAGPGGGNNNENEIRQGKNGDIVKVYTDPHTGDDRIIRITAEEIRQSYIDSQKVVDSFSRIPAKEIKIDSFQNTFQGDVARNKAVPVDTSMGTAIKGSMNTSGIALKDLRIAGSDEDFSAVKKPPSPSLKP